MADQASEWIEWRGGVPGEGESRIWSATAIRLRDGRDLDCTNLAPCLRWRHIGRGDDIVAYSLTAQVQS